MLNKVTRVALVTGATGGLGTAMCKKLYQDGYNVVGTYISEGKVAKWKLLMQSESMDIPIYRMDVTDFDDCAKTIAQIEAEIGVIDILVNNAGITRDTQLRKMNPQQWKEVIDTNLNSVFNTTRNVINSMVEREFGRIINISSVNGQKGQFGQTNYSAAKAGLHGFTKSLAMEVAKKGVTVNTISPGYIATDMVMAVQTEYLNQIIAQIPIGRLGGTDEVAYLISFLASENASFITGANIAINGGQHVY